MEFELEAQQPAPVEDRGWRRSVAVLVVLLALVVAAQLYGVRTKGRSVSDDDSSKREQALISGDFYVKLDQASPSGKIPAAALRSYREALPWPRAYRRLGVLEEVYKKSGLDYFKKLDSPQATRRLSKAKIAKLHREKAMWLSIFTSEKITPEEARRDLEQIQTLNLGPLRKAAIAQVYLRSGQHKKYEHVQAEVKAAAQLSLGLWVVLLVVLVLGGVAGLVGAVLFLTLNASRFETAPRLALQGTMLMTAFIVYLASYIGLGGLIEALGDAAGMSISEWSGSAYMAMVIATALTAFCLGMLTLVGRARGLGQDWRLIGFRTENWRRDVWIGVAGFFGSLPFVFAALIIALLLTNTVFKHFKTPEQPFDQIATQGGALGAVLVFLAASVVAPIVEETFFRGALYSAFRTKLCVWPSVLLTSAVFAVIHPLPGGFLPIFTLACVLALLRERSGSLLPGMVCHCIYNTVVLAVTTLVR